MNVTGVTLSATVPTPIQPGSGASAPAVCVRNHGPGVAYLGDSTMVSPATGRGLTVGASLNWPAGSPLFVTTDTTTMIDVYDTVGAEFNPQAIADSLTASGLAGDIANQISIAGAPTLRSATLLQHYDGSSANFFPTGWDTTPFTHLIIVAIAEQGMYLLVEQVLTTTEVKTRRLQLPAWVGFPGVGGNSDYFVVACEGPFARVTAVPYATPGQITLSVIGTNSPLPYVHETYNTTLVAAGVTVTGGLEYGVLQLTTPNATGTWRSYVPHNDKPFTVSATSSGGGVAKYQWLARYYNAGVGKDIPIGNIITVTGGGNFDAPVRVVPPPFGALILTVTTTSASTTTFDIIYNS